MNRVYLNVFMILVSVFVCSCNEEVRTWNNAEFKESVDSYVTYLDSLFTDPENDYICIYTNSVNDTTVIEITLRSGPFYLLNNRKEVKDFFNYGSYNICLSGDFPNRIVKFRRNEKIDKIIRKLFPGDYKLYKHDPNSVLPTLTDYMKMTLIFKGDELIKSMHQYY